MKKYGAALLAFILLLTALPALADGTGDFLKVWNPNPGDRLNLRKEPDIDSISFGKYYSGTQVELTGSIRNGWAPVKIGPLKGYMQADYLVSDPNHALTDAMPRVEIDNQDGDGLNLRKRPDDSSDVIAFYPNGRRVTVMGVSEDWCHVNVEGREGFMWADGLSPRPQFKKTTPTARKDTLYVWNNHPTNRLNLRESPSRDAPTLGKYYSGTAVTVLPDGHTSDWKHVQIGTLSGYMLAKYLDNGSAVRANQPLVTVSNPSGSGLNLRSEPSSRSKKLAFCPNGTQAVVLGVSQDWCHVVAGGQTGFLLREKLDPELKFDLSE